MSKKEWKEKAIEMYQTSMYFNEISQTTEELFVELLRNGYLSENGYKLVCKRLEDCVEAVQESRQLNILKTEWQECKERGEFDAIRPNNQDSK